jgi:hypothetical protein
MNKFAAWAIIICVSFLPRGFEAAAGEPEWKVGLAQVKITPEQPVLMSGYAGRTKPFEKVAADLYVKAMVLEDKTGQRAVLVTSDLLGFPAAVAEPICERIEKKLVLARDRILLNSSHTHAGPLLDLTATGKNAAGEALRTVEYTRQLQDKVVEAVVQAAARLEPAQLSWSSGVVHFVIRLAALSSASIHAAWPTAACPSCGLTGPMANRAAFSSAPPFTAPRSARTITSSAAITPAMPRPTSRSATQKPRPCSCSAAPATPIPIRAARWS